jgi:predicted amidohydrolase
LPAADMGLKLKVATVQFRSSFDVKQNCERIVAHLRRLSEAGVQV